MLFFNVSNRENNKSQDLLIKSSPDIIIVFTGDSGRIPYATEILKKKPNSKILITGISPSFTIEKFTKHLKEKHPDISIDPANITFDTMAANTVENAIFTMRHLLLNPNLQNILIISHDYHILRIKLIVETINNLDDPRNFYYLGIKTDYTELRNLKILFNETLKLIKTSGFLLLWEKNTRLESSYN